MTIERCLLGTVEIFANKPIYFISMINKENIVERLGEIGFLEGFFLLIWQHTISLSKFSSFLINNLINVLNNIKFVYFWYLSRLKIIHVETILYSLLNYKTTILCACSSQHIWDRENERNFLYFGSGKSHVCNAMYKTRHLLCCGYG